jgi:hypothetical protein
MSERGAMLAELRRTVQLGSMAAAKFGRSRFRLIHSFNASWNGKYYARKQIDAFAAKMQDGWLARG